MYLHGFSLVYLVNFYLSYARLIKQQLPFARTFLYDLQGIFIISHLKLTTHSIVRVPNVVYA